MKHWRVILGMTVVAVLSAAAGAAGKEAYAAYRNAQAGAQAFNYLASPVKLPDGREVALGDILAQMAKAAAQNSQPAETPKAGK